MTFLCPSSWLSRVGLYLTSWTLYQLFGIQTAQSWSVSSYSHLTYSVIYVLCWPSMCMPSVKATATMHSPSLPDVHVLGTTCS
ncbi:hypothetical protein GGR50DRAFT_5749 [Xylaria sp. CBS 124048]|nr:hypothetical protein GGR50DRAFT_5749 [Xylaria sp. CBS 124048]